MAFHWSQKPAGPHYWRLLPGCLLLYRCIFPWLLSSPGSLPYRRSPLRSGSCVGSALPVEKMQTPFFCKTGFYAESFKDLRKAQISFSDLAVLVCQDQDVFSVFGKISGQFRSSQVFFLIHFPVSDRSKKDLQFFSRTRSICCANWAVGIALFL